MKIYELNFVMISLSKTEFFADIHQKSMIPVGLLFFFMPQIKLQSVNRFQSTNAFLMELLKVFISNFAL